MPGSQIMFSSDCLQEAKPARGPQCSDGVPTLCRKLPSTALGLLFPDVLTMHTELLSAMQEPGLTPKAIQELFDVLDRDSGEYSFAVSA